MIPRLQSQTQNTLPLCHASAFLYVVRISPLKYTTATGLNAVLHARTQPQSLQRGVHHKPSWITLIQEEAFDTTKTP